MRERISRTAAWGSLTSGPRIVDKQVREAMEGVLKDIESGQFAEDWLKESRAGNVNFTKMQKDEAGHKSESAGRRIRELMPYIDKNRSS